MLETLRAYGAGLLAEAGEQDGAAAALARYALQVAEQGSAGLQTIGEELAAARWLDAEDATMRQVLAWAMQHDAAVALRLAVALGWWWRLRGRLAGQYPLLREAAGGAEPGSEGWCAAQFWLGYTALGSGDLAEALGHFTVLRNATAERGPYRALVDGLMGRSGALGNMGRYSEAAEDARRALALARQLGYPLGEAAALAGLSFAAQEIGDYDGAVRLARQAGQITVGIPGSIARWCSYALIIALIEAGDLAAAEPVCAATLARSQNAGDLGNQAALLPWMVTLDLEAGRIHDAVAHLRESLQLITRTGSWLALGDALDRCGLMCAATGRFAEAVTVWAAVAGILQDQEMLDVPRNVGRREASLYKAREALGADRTRAAEERGAAMSLSTAAEYALMLTDSVSPQPATPVLGRLSVRERELVALVAQGRTDAQIAAQLYISIRTVRSHLDRIRDKTGCRRRADLTRLALTAELI
jgi:DNA-binding CsgD family transcriptional regulator